MTAAHSPQPDGGGGVGRRELLRRGGTIAAGGAATVYVGDRWVPRFSPVGRAHAFGLVAGAVILTAGIGIGLAGAGIAGMNDHDEIQAQRAKELHDRVFLDATEMEMAQAPLLESLAGDASMIRQLCRADAAFAIMQAASDEAGETQATTDAKDAVSSAVAGVEANFFDAWTSQFTRLRSRISLVKDNPDLDPTTPWSMEASSDPLSPGWLVGNSANTDDNFGGTASVTLVNGETAPCEIVLGTPNTGQGYMMVPWSGSKSYTLPSGETTTEPSSYGSHYSSYQDDSWSFSTSYGVKAFSRESESVQALHSPDWWAIHNELMTIHSEELTHAETMASNLYQPAVDGEVNFAEIASGSAILEEARDGDLGNWKQVAGIYRALWMPEGEKPVVVSLENGVELEGLLFWTEPSSALSVGEEINPSSTIGRFYMAAEISYVPPVESSDQTATIDVTVQDSSGSAMTDATVAVKGHSSDYTVDDQGVVTIDVRPGFRTFYVTDADSTSSETAITMEVADGDDVTITHDGSDNTSYQADPFENEQLTPEDEGTALPAQMTEPFTIEGIDGGGSQLDFVKPDTVEPTDDFDKFYQMVQDAAEDEQETREETREIIVESGGFSFPSLDGAGGGIIAGAIALIGVAWGIGKAGGE
ncbi:hypothetical protein [Halovivax limisalsi]|uniref:hypothetical protein n=1 Tax=Halovivax limisalsi TaxID=1453760 RepID=UPI001FFCF067|nr:hypothetical protein [Halovivax limisalsi]